MNRVYFTIVFVAMLICNCRAAQAHGAEPKNENKIQVAILLDTSNSMDGLIEQAKSRLWNIVNTLTTLKYKGEEPKIEIALYEYGNDGLSQKNDYIRQVTPLTTDLDLISEQLFGLRTNGGLEYCGAVIRHAAANLDWGKNAAFMRLIYIAGNESFEQGSVDYREAIGEALEKGIFVNTIYCGNYDSGIDERWKLGADAGKGKYFNIDPDAKVRYIVTPYDERISRCNERLNNTYISYGAAGISKQVNQSQQDKNAAAISSANYAERVVSKSKSAYRNDSWDLVDKAKTDEKALSQIKQNELPKEYRDKSEAELKAIVEQKAKEREEIQKEIAELAKQRQQFMDAEMQKSNSEDDLGNAINSSIKEFAEKKGYEIKE